MKEMPTSGEDSRRVLRRLMTKLAQQSGVLPASLFLHNVGCRSRNNPVFNGGFADIYKGTHKGRCVAIKRLRSWIEVKDVVRQKTTQVSCSHASEVLNLTVVFRILSKNVLYGVFFLILTSCLYSASMRRCFLRDPVWSLPGLPAVTLRNTWGTFKTTAPLHLHPR